MESKSWALFLGIAFSFFSDANSTEPFRFALGLILSSVAIISIVVLPGRLKPLILLLLLINSPDNTQSDSDIAEAGGILSSATIWQMSIGPIKPSWITVLLLLYLISSIRAASLSKSLLLFMGYFAVVPTIASLAYGFTFSSPVGMVISDLRFPLLLGLSWFYLRSYFNIHAQDVSRLVEFAFFLAIGRFIVDGFYFVSGQSHTYISEINRLSVDSSKMLIVPVIVVLIHNIISRKLLALSTLGTCVFIQVLFAYHTRLLLVTAGLGLCVLSCIVPLRKFAISCACLLAVFIGAYSVIPESYFETVITSTGRFISVKEEENITGIAAVDPIRVACIINASEALNSHKGWLWGLGYGSWYPESPIPFPSFADLGSAFPNEWVESGQYYRVHDMASHLIFKYGIIGFLIFTYCGLGVWIRRFREIRQIPSAWKQPGLVGLLCMAPTLYLYGFWSAKGSIIIGIYIALMEAFVIRKESQVICLRLPGVPAAT